MTAPFGPSLGRVERGLRLIQLSVALVVLSLGLLAVGWLRSPAGLFAAGLLVVATLLLGKVFCLFAPRGRMLLAAGLAVDLTGLVVVFGSLESFLWLAVCSIILFRGFLHQLARALGYPPLQDAIGKSAKFLLAGVLVWVGGVGLGFLLGGLRGEIINVTAFIGFALAGTGYLLGGCLILRSCYEYLRCLGLARQAVQAAIARDNTLPSSAA